VTDAIRACPACDSTNIYTRRATVTAPPDAYAYRCERCGERFDDPTVRPPANDGHIPGDTLAYRLSLADPEEVRGD